jgi:hypothetical protein
VEEVMAKRINGKPMAHWKRMAKEVVVEILVRAATNFGWRSPGSDPDPRQSIIHKFAADRLMALAKVEDPGMVREILHDRAKFEENAARALAEILGGGK